MNKEELQNKNKEKDVGINANHCIYCQEIIPEGGWVCPSCMKEYFKVK